MPELILSNPSVRQSLSTALAGLFLCASLAAQAQTATLPPTDISNQEQPAPMPPPAVEVEPAPSDAVPAPSDAVPAPATPAVVPEAPAAIAPPVPAPMPPPVVEAPPPVAIGGEPLAGFSDGTAFLRAPDNSFVLFPSGRLQVDNYVFHSANKVPNNTFLIRRARLEVGGWIGGFVYFWLAGDFAQGPAAAAAPVAPANIATTDDYVALAPWKNLVILQVGQYDGPFTLENRTSDKYFDFMERSLTVRAFGIPDNKVMGAMLHGYNDARNFYYSLALVNGDGQNFKNADNHFDWMGRGWVAPFSFTGDGPLHDVEIGASFWTGDRGNTLALPNQTTQGTFTFLNMGSFTATSGGTTTTYQLRQAGRLNSVALELNAPVAHKYGARGEFVWRHSPLAEETIATNGTGALQPGVAGADLRGTSFYGEVFAWVLGDDKIIGDQQGIEPLSRYAKFGVKPVRDGVMVALRYEHLDETVSDPDTKGSPAVGKTVVDSGELGVNYWHSKRFRATFNYVVNHFDRGSGATPLLQKLASAWEHEFLFRLAVAL